MTFHVETNNNTQFPRFMIVRNDGLYWNEKGWSGKEDAMLYADPDIAIQEQQQLRVAEFGLVDNKTRFAIPFVLDVCSGQDINMEEVRDWVKKAIGFYVDAQTHGDGPSNSLVIGHLDIGNIQEVVVV